jgi:hypothetical protein
MVTLAEVLEAGDVSSGVVELRGTMAEVLEAGDVGCAVLSLPKCEMLVIYNHGGTENTRRLFFNRWIA